MKNHQSLRFFIYARKSKKIRNGTHRTSDGKSLVNQVAVLQELASADKLEVIHEMTENISARYTGRPMFNEMLKRIEKGEANAILAWRPDRLARNPIDAGRLIDMIDRGKIKALRFPGIPFDPSSQGLFSLSIMLAQAKLYSDALGENIRMSIHRKVLNGIWPVNAPVGYLNDQKTKTIFPDTEKASIVRKAFELYATGDFTLDRLTETVNGLGLATYNGTPLSRSQYHRMLQNPLYCGIIRFRNELHPAKHEALVSKEIFDCCQKILHRKSKPKSRELKPYLYRGMFHCGACDCFITTETQKGHNYLRCTRKKGVCSERFVREESIAGQITGVLLEKSLPDGLADWMLSELELRRQFADTEADTQLIRLRSELRDIEAKLERLTTAYVEEALSLKEFQNAKKKLVESQAELQERIDELKANRGKRLEPVIQFV